MSAGCLIIDDEPFARKLLIEHVSKVEGLHVAGECVNAVEATAWLRAQPVDLIFLDVQMPEISGLQFIRSLKNAPAVIFTTAYRDFAPEAFDADAVDYLVKPISFERFLRAVNRFLDDYEAIPGSKRTSRADDHVIYIRADRKTVKLALADVRYIESLDDYVKVHTSNKAWVTRENISKLAQHLPESFVRIHRSFIINTRFLTAFTGESVFLDKQELPLGRAFKHAALQQMKMRHP